MTLLAILLILGAATAQLTQFPDAEAISSIPTDGVLPVPSIGIQSIEDPSAATEWFFDVFPPYEQRTARQYTIDAPDNQGVVVYITEECCPGDAYQVDVVGNNGVQPYTATTAGGQFGDCQAVPTNGWDACTRNTDFATATYTSGVYSRVALLLPPGASYVLTVSVFRDRTPESSNPFFVGVALADCNVPSIMELPEGTYSITCPTCSVNAECPPNQCCFDGVCRLPSEGVSCGRDDPHVLGFDGMPFDFHAEHGAVLSLLTTPRLLVNARMSDMGSVDGGSWMDMVAVRTASGARVSMIAMTDDAGLGCAEVRDEHSVLFSSCNQLLATGNATVVDVGLRFYVTTNGHAILHATTEDALIVCEQAAAPAMHLDVSFQLLRELDAKDVSGVIGQSLAWRLEDGVPEPLPEDVFEVDDVFDGDSERGTFVSK